MKNYFLANELKWKTDVFNTPATGTMWLRRTWKFLCFWMSWDFRFTDALTIKYTNKNWLTTNQLLQRRFCYICQKKKTTTKNYLEYFVMMVVHTKTHAHILHTRLMTITTSAHVKCICLSFVCTIHSHSEIKCLPLIFKYIFNVRTQPNKFEYIFSFSLSYLTVISRICHLLFIIYTCVWCLYNICLFVGGQMYKRRDHHPSSYVCMFCCHC